MVSEVQPSSVHILTREEILVPISRKTRVTVKSLGDDMELRYVAVRDIVAFAALLHEPITDRDFAAKVVHNQLIEPQVEAETLQRLPDDELQSILEAFLRNETFLFDEFVDTGDFFKDFRQAVQAQHDKRIQERARDTMSAVQQSLRHLGDSFAQNYGSVLMGLGTTQSLVQHALEGLLDPFRLAAEAVQDRYHDSFRSVFDGLDLTLQGVPESFSSLAETIMLPWAEQQRSMIEGITSSFHSLAEASIRPWTDQLLQINQTYSDLWDRFEKRYRISASVAATILEKYNWFIAPSMELEFVFEVVTVGQSQKRQEQAINSLFVRYYEANNWRRLSQLVDSWKHHALLKKRHKILRDCVHVLKHVRKRSLNIANLVLPTIISQIDGTFNDYLRANNAYVAGYENKKAKAKAMVHEVIGYQLDDLAKGVLLDILYQKYIPGTPLNKRFDFNRHMILHGDNTRYGRKDYMIRAFMILDLLAHW